MNTPDMESPVKDEQHEKLGMQANGTSEESFVTPKRRSCVDEDPNNLTVDCNSTINSTINSECNITVIHVNGDSSSGGGGTLISEPDDEGNTPNTLDKKDYAAEGKDSKDGSDSGVEGCAVEPPRVQSRNSVDYASSCNGLDEASCDSSLVSCCSVYEDPCASLAEDMPQPANDSQPNGGEGTSEAGSESSSVAGCTSSTHKHKRPNVTTAQPKKKLTSLTDSMIKSGIQKATKATSATVNGTTSTGARAKPKTTNQRSTLTKSQSVSRDRGRTRDKSVA